MRKNYIENSALQKDFKNILFFFFQTVQNKFKNKIVFYFFNQIMMEKFPNLENWTSRPNIG